MYNIVKSEKEDYIIITEQGYEKNPSERYKEEIQQKMIPSIESKILEGYIPVGNIQVETTDSYEFGKPVKILHWTQAMYRPPTIKNNTVKGGGKNKTKTKNKNKNKTKSKK